MGTVESAQDILEHLPDEWNAKIAITSASISLTLLWNENARLRVVEGEAVVIHNEIPSGYLRAEFDKNFQALDKAEVSSSSKAWGSFFYSSRSEGSMVVED